MAKSTIISSVLLLVCAVVLKPAVAAIEPAPLLNSVEPAPGYDASIEGCIKKMTKPCGQELSHNIFHYGPDVSNSCCRVLVAMGDPCHSEFIDVILSNDKYSAHAAEYLKRSQNTWKRCKSIVAGN